MKTAVLFLGIAVALSSNLRAEQRWKYEEQVDDISNAKVRTVAVVGEDNKSVLVLRVEQDKKPTLVLVPNKVLFPDKTDAESKVMGVQITMRSTAMDKPMTVLWRMNWMDYKSASVAVGPETASTKVFGGDAVTFQLDKAGARFKFPTKGAGCDGLQEAVSKAVEIASRDGAVVTK